MTGLTRRTLDPVWAGMRPEYPLNGACRAVASGGMRSAGAVEEADMRIASIFARSIFAK